MMIITLDNEQQTINVPQSWSEIRLCDYEKWFGTEPKNRKEEIQLIARICGIELDAFLENPTRLYEIVAESMNFIFDTNVGDPSNTIKIDGQQFAMAFSDDITLGEWIDIESVFENDNPTRLSHILAILCSPVGEDYDSRKTEGRRQLFAELTMDKALPLLAFFLHRKELFETISSLCSKIEAETDHYLRITQHFAANGAGIKSLPIWQRIKFCISVLYLKNRLSKFSAFLSTVVKKVELKKNRRNSKNKLHVNT